VRLCQPSGGPVGLKIDDSSVEWGISVDNHTEAFVDVFLVIVVNIMFLRRYILVCFACYSALVAIGM